MLMVFEEFFILTGYRGKKPQNYFSFKLKAFTPAALKPKPNENVCDDGNEIDFVLGFKTICLASRR